MLKGQADPSQKSEQGRAVHELAKIAGLSHDTIAKAKIIVEKASEETKDNLRRGTKGTSINQVHADIVRESKRIEIKAKLESTAAVTAKKAEGVYDVIVIDPPWPMEKIERDCRPNQVALDYPTMTESRIESVNVPYANDAHVWLWTTHKFLPMAFRLLVKWGLNYVCCMTWCKNGGFQPMGLPQYNSEFVLYARKGSPQFISTKDFKTSFHGKRREHSRKPDEFFQTITRVTAGRRLEMFARNERKGWDSWGNETNKFHH
jgi:N6-adenosine-specific RNA methylase IME4